MCQLGFIIKELVNDDVLLKIFGKNNIGKCTLIVWLFIVSLSKQAGGRVINDNICRSYNLIRFANTVIFLFQVCVQVYTTTL